MEGLAARMSEACELIPRCEVGVKPDTCSDGDDADGSDGTRGRERGKDVVARRKERRGEREIQ